MQVGIISAGEMGASIGSTLASRGVTVTTCLDGRSLETRARAQQSHMKDVGSLDDFIATSDLVLSVLVPSEALSFAETIAGSIQRTAAHPTFVDCNAVAPRTMSHIATLIADAGASVVDACILGPPMKPGADTRFYCAGPQTGDFESLGDYGIPIRRISNLIGQASALKMAYATSTKVTTALWIQLLVAAQKMNVLTPLLEELTNDPVANKLIANIPTVPRRAGRWVGEMQEISEAFRAEGLPVGMPEAAAEVFRAMAASVLSGKKSIGTEPETLDILSALAEHVPYDNDHT